MKWSGVWFLAFFAVLSLFWDRAAWREAGVPRPTARRRCGAGCPARCGRWPCVPVLTYLATFTGWFLGETSQGKAWAAAEPRHRRTRSSRTRCARCGTSTPSG